jgi:hypothetical protein
VFWGTWFSLSRSIAAIRPETFLEISSLDHADRVA